jgi:hypothetical protein
MKTLSCLLWLLCMCLVPHLPAAAQCRFEKVGDPSADEGRLVLENSFIRLEVAPFHGGPATRFYYKPAKKELVHFVSSTAASVFLACYPADYAQQEPEKRRRVVLTAKQEFLNPGAKGSNSVGKLSDAEPWLLFYDRYFDVGAGRGTGPCAFAYDVSRTKVVVRCGNYQASATATLLPGVREASFVLWDFAGITNADAIQYMKNLEIEQKR